MDVNIYNKKGENAGTIELPENIFGLKWNNALVWQVAESERANKRKGTAHTKTRGEVRGGGKKPWRQKGTGRARHGSIRSPIWIGGGVTHGPRSEKIYAKKINKKMKIKALYTALSQKIRDHEIIFIEDISIQSGKTKDAAALIKALSRAEWFGELGKKGNTLVAMPNYDIVSMRAFRNLRNIHVNEIRNMSVGDVFAFRYIIFPKEGVKVLESRLR